MRVGVLEELRRRVEEMERRGGQGGRGVASTSTFASPSRSTVSLTGTGTGAGGAMRLEEIPGATREEDGVVVVRAVVPAEERVGRVAPADALVGSVEVAGALAGLGPEVPKDLLQGVRVLDLETTGLAGGAGTLAFLVGVARFAGDGALVVEQLVLSRPSVESKMLARLDGLLEGATLLVTFNGKAFDVPLLRTRCVLTRRSAGRLEAVPHLDLLGVARRLWRGRGDDCRQITLEERVLGRRRSDDLPGAMAPAAYATWLTVGDAGPLARVVEHNRDDLVGAMALLVAALRTHEDPLTWAEDDSELLAVAEHRLRRAGPAAAVPLLTLVAERARGGRVLRRALARLAYAERRTGQFDAARRTWERYRARFPAENLGHLEVAKLLEHRVCDPEAALAAARAAPQPEDDGVALRLERLARKVAAGRGPAAR